MAELDRSAAGAGVPVIDTWYTVLDVVGPGVLYTVQEFREDDDAVAKKVQGRLTVDDFVTDDLDRDLNDATTYFGFISPNCDTLLAEMNFVTTLTSVVQNGSALYFKNACKYELRCHTDALGANPELRGTAFYGLKL